MSTDTSEITESFTRSHDTPTRYCVVHEMYEDGEWVVTEDYVDVTVVGTESVGEEGVVYFYAPEDDTNLIVRLGRFITAYTEGVTS